MGIFNIINFFFNKTVDVFIVFSSISTFKKLVNITVGPSAVAYYAEIHKSPYNSFLHTLNIPIAAYYFYSGFPKFFGLTKKQANTFIINLNISFFIIYFMELSFIGTIKTIILYSPSLLLFLHEPSYPQHSLIKGFLIMGFTEILGHLIFEEKNSRLDGIGNAILYSHYFNANHF